MTNNNEQFKLNTRRYLAWVVGGVAIGVIGFGGVWGVLNGVMEIATLAFGVLATTLGSIMTHYFKKTSEE